MIDNSACENATVIKVSSNSLYPSSHCDVIWIHNEISILQLIFIFVHDLDYLKLFLMKLLSFRSIVLTNTEFSLKLFSFLLIYSLLLGNHTYLQMAYGSWMVWFYAVLINSINLILVFFEHVKISPTESFLFNLLISVFNVIDHNGKKLKDERAISYIRDACTEVLFSCFF